MSDLLDRIDKLSPKQRELLLRRMKTQAKETSQPEEVIPRQSRKDGRFVLSFSQLRQWILEQLEPGTAAYNLPAPIRLRGELDVAALERGLGVILRRHETLRTTFEAGGEEPVQVIHPPSDFTLPVHDLSHLPAEEREAAIKEKAMEDAETPFDLERGPLVRFTLLRAADDEHVLLFTLHHIISDGWSRGVFFRELETLYDAYRQGREAELDELEIQYADFSVWQRGHLAGEVLEKHLDYWRKQLADEPPALELPSDRPRPKVATSAGAQATRRIPAEVAEKLRELSRKNGASLFMTAMAAWKTLLYRTTGQRDVTVGTFIASRNRKQVAPLIGFFVNTLAMRSRLDPKATFQETLENEREVSLGAFAHQDLPFEKLIEELRPERDTALTPFFQTMLVLQNMRRKELTLSNLEAGYVEMGHHHVDFDLTMWIWESETELQLVLDYRTDLFDASTAERILGFYARVLAAVADEPQRKLEELPLLDEADLRQVVEDWNDTARDLPARPIHRLLEERAKKYADSPALEHGAEVLTYAELDATANRLAHRLVAAGVGPDSLVAISLPRSTDQVMALLAVLKAGGAYLPLDPDYPADRRSFMLADSGAAVLLDAGEGRSDLDLPEGLVTLAIDDLRPELDGLPATPPEVLVDLEGAAYVIYTSGSTGKPKGVVVPHRALANYAQDAALAYGVVAADRVLQFATVSFDTSVEEIYPTLLEGATLVLRDDEMIVSIADFLRRLDELRITVLNLPTAFWHQITTELESGGPGIPERLRRTIIGGEKATVSHLAAWQRRAGDTELVNTYGPTEATVVTTRRELHGEGAPVATELALARREIPLGRPVSNAKVYVLDRSRRPVPPGVVGEIAIAGAGLARGYLGRPATTAERFVPNPWSAEAGGRLYLSGDLGKWRQDGQLEFAGRVDHQVKVRGFRVELGEIENALRSQAEIDDAVVEARKAGDDLRLVAYLVAGGEKPALADLKAALGTRLPEYMVPAVFIFLDELPTTPSGKVDRRALPDPADAEVERGVAYVAPRTTAESLLAEIWEELLGVSRVGIADNFFDLGGHSLLATRLVARVRATFDAEIPLMSIFDSPTLEDMARAIERLENVESTPLPPIERLPRKEGENRFPLSFPQERIWVLNELQGDNLAYHFVFLVNFEGPLDPDLLKRCLDELVRRHEIYRTTFHQHEGRPVQLVHPMPVEATFELVDLSHLPLREATNEAARMAAQAARDPFVLSQMPLVRWQLYRLSDEESIFAQVEHHFLHDGWSVTVFLRELQALYEAFLEGRPSPLEEPEVQFGDFAHWQQELVSGPYFDKLRDYWVGKVADADRVLELPTDFPRPRVNRFEGEMIPIILPDTLYDALHDFGLKHHTSLYITMLAGFYALLYRYTGQESVMIGSAIANRRLKEAEGLIGMIVNTILLRGDVDGEMSFEDLLAQVRRTVLEAHAHQDMPFEKLVGALNPERDLSRNPLFQVMFAFHDSQVPEIRFAGVKGILRGAHNASAKADLNIVVIPKAEQHRGTERTYDDGEGEHLILYWEYNTDLFERHTMERMAEHYRRLLEGFVAEPGRAILKTPMTSAEERRQVVVEWNSTAAEYPRHLGLHQLFEERAKATPEATALVSSGESLTYGELEARANRLAHHLLGLGLEREQFVGVACDRSAHLLTALLAVLKAGGAYLPIDPSFPADRVALMLEDTGAPIVLTLEGLASGLPQSGATTVLLDREDVSRHPATAPAVPALPDSLAYVLHTSGSTGRPKGVAVSHRAVVNFLASMAKEPGLSKDDVLLAVTTISFDIAGLELYLPLSVGATVVLADRETAADGERLAALLESSGTTVMQATPATWQLLFTSGWQGSPALKVLCGGEALPPELGRRLKAACREVWNLYGPTETTIWSAVRRFEDGDEKAASVPIGKPIMNTQVYVLDRNLEPTPVGVPGELQIGGDGLARGYLGRPGQTAERFRPDPFATDPGGRLYVTGDLVRSLPDGTLTFLGRLDHQVKVRGFRIELGEIESALDRHPAVERAVAVTRPDPAGNPRILAYYVPQNGGGDAAELREHLRQHLPEYMVPAAFVPLDAFPLTPNGKVDRKTLGRDARFAPESTLDSAAPSVPPRTPLEEELQGLWHEVLGREGVGVHDSFFDLGGHSLLATQVIGRLAAAYGVRLALVEFFEHPTLAGQAELIDARRGTAVAGEERIRATDADSLVAQAADLDDADLDALLGNMMEDDG